MVSNPHQARPPRSQRDVGQYSTPKIILLHLLPGFVITALYLTIAPVIMANGWPPLLALLIAGFVGTVPVQLGHLFYVGRKLNASWSIAGVLRYNKPARLWQYLLLVPLVCAVAFLVLFLTMPLDQLLSRTVFSWLPGWYFYSDPAVFAPFSRRILAITFGLRIALDGLLFPIVEELYFRGYLLPKLERFGPLSPFLNHSLFTAYHLWQPQNWPTILFGIFPMVWLAWWKRNYYFSLWIHLLLNLSGAVLTFAMLVH